MKSRIFLVVAAYGCFVLSSSAAVPRYSEDPEGTRIVFPPEVASLPFDKPYQDLTPAEKRQVRSLYEKLGVNDEPPFPKEGLKAIFDDIVKLHRKVIVEGKLFVAVHVDATGHAKSVSIVQTTAPQLNNVLATILIAAQYKPGKCDGKPCAMDFPVSASFERVKPITLPAPVTAPN